MDDLPDGVAARSGTDVGLADQQRAAQLARRATWVVDQAAAVATDSSIMVSAQAVHLLCEAGVPIVHLSSGNWFCGITSGIGLRNAYDRAAQFAIAARRQ